MSTTASEASAVRTLVSVLGAPIDAITPRDAVLRIEAWASRRESRVVCICNVHSVVTAANSADFMQVLARSDMNTPDGAPVAWMLRRQGVPGQSRVSGPDLMLEYCAHAAQSGQSLFLYGGRESTITALREHLLRRWPNLIIAGTMSPPFRPLSDNEDDEVVRIINSSGAGTVWVGLGCPKQEQWMHVHKDRIHAVMIGVGAAFDFHAGTVPRAPQWMRQHGLEWFHRLCSEPRRLFGRYLLTNSAFIFGALRQLLKSR